MKETSQCEFLGWFVRDRLIKVYTYLYLIIHNSMYHFSSEKAILTVTQLKSTNVTDMWWIPFQFKHGLCLRLLSPLTAPGVDKVRGFGNLALGLQYFMCMYLVQLQLFSEMVCGVHTATQHLIIIDCYAPQLLWAVVCSGLCGLCLKISDRGGGSNSSKASQLPPVSSAHYHRTFDANTIVSRNCTGGGPPLAHFLATRQPMIPID